MATKKSRKSDLLVKNEIPLLSEVNSENWSSLRFSYEVLGIELIVNLMNEEVSKIQNIINLPQNEIRKFLNLEKWDAEVFLEKFYDGRFMTSETEQENKDPFGKDNSHDTILSQKSENTGHVQRRSGRNRTKVFPQMENTDSASDNAPRRYKRILEAPMNNDRHISKRSAGIERNPKMNCEICFESFNIEDVRQLPCKHIFCYVCLKQYLSTTLDNTSTIDCIVCPGFNCNRLLSDELVLDKLEKGMKAKYQQLITNGFVQSNRLIKWCPGPGCNKAIKISEMIQSGVRCTCGFYFCFKCTNEVHDLIPCQLLQDFANVKATNLEVASWLLLNSKQCPNCHVEIEKNGGCNHITCRMCRHEFCWICFAPWGVHNRCVSSDVQIIQTDDLRRLIDANNKRQTMIQSINFDEKMYKSTLKQQDLEAEEQWIKIDFVKHAVEVLLRCRRTLADSYVFAYFFRNDNDTQWIRFNLNQISLTQATEGLSHVLETKVNGSNFHEMKRLVKDHETLCKGLHRALFAHVQEGFEGDSWTKTM